MEMSQSITETGNHRWGELYGRFALNPPPPTSTLGKESYRNGEHVAHVELFSSLCLYGCHYPTGNSLAYKAQLTGAGYLDPASTCRDSSFWEMPNPRSCVQETKYSNH